MKKLEFFISGLVIFCGYIYLKRDERPTIEIENGILRGIIAYSVEDNLPYKAFYGIPYAEPPIKELRFEDPIPLKKNWTGIRDASYFRSPCIQVDILWTGFSFGEEDCLFVNVFVPIRRASDKPFPVLVYFHGGYWHMGSSQEHGEKRFMNEDVILITFNYRLGALGFLSTGDKTLRGNQGLKDQNLVLHWIKRNLKYFNGDENKVTIFGESVGGVSTHLHILSPLSKGLFAKSISQSGTALNLFALSSDAKSQSIRFAEKFSCPTDNNQDMINCLKTIDAKTLVLVHLESRDLFNRNDQTLFSPVIETIKDEKSFITEDPQITLEKGNFPKIPWLTGVNSHEGMFASMVMLSNKTKQDLLLNNWQDTLPQYLAYKEDDKITKEIRSYYFKEGMSREEFEANLTNSVSDRAFFHPVSTAAKLYSQHAPTYLYIFNYRTFLGLEVLFEIAETDEYVGLPIVTCFTKYLWKCFQEYFLGTPMPTKGTCHGDELPILFTLGWMPQFMFPLPTRDAMVSKMFIKLWTSFAKSDQLLFDEMDWKPVNYTKQKRLHYLEIGENPKIIKEPFSEGVAFWEMIKHKFLLKNR